MSKPLPRLIGVYVTSYLANRRLHRKGCIWESLQSLEHKDRSSGSNKTNFNLQHIRGSIQSNPNRNNLNETTITQKHSQVYRSFLNRCINH